MGKYKRRADGRLQAQVNITDENGNTVRDEKGRIKRKLIYAWNPEELEAKIKNAKTKQSTAPAQPPTSKPEPLTQPVIDPLPEIINPTGPTVKAWSEEWLQTFKLEVAPGTKKMYEFMINKYITPAIGNRYLADMTMPELQSVINIPIRKGHPRPAGSPSVSHPDDPIW